MNDKKQGQTAIVLLDDGTTAEGPMVDGLKNGQWTFTRPNGGVEKGSVVDFQGMGIDVIDHWTAG